MGDYIGAYNGNIVFPKSLYTKDVKIEAVAYSLSLNCRFCGHTLHMWSVAQHSLLVDYIIQNSDIASEAESNGLSIDMLRLLGLLHDASEAYLSDICRPIKVTLPDYTKYEKHTQNKILLAFGIYSNGIDRYTKFIRKADDIALYNEAEVLMNPNSTWRNDYRDGFELLEKYKFTEMIKMQNPQVVKSVFLYRVHQLVESLNLDNAPFEDIEKYYTNSDYIPIIECGECLGYIIDTSDEYKVKPFNDDKIVDIPKKEADNRFDLSDWV